jgi:hypothetical protein
MKITKTKLKEIIKQEILSEMKGITTMDPLTIGDFDVKEPESFAVMDQVFNVAMGQIEQDCEDALSLICNYLVTNNPNANTKELGLEARNMLYDLGMRFPSQMQAEKLIKGMVSEDD